MTKYKIMLDCNLRKNKHSYKFDSVLRRIVKLAREQNRTLLYEEDELDAYIYVGEPYVTRP